MASPNQFAVIEFDANGIVMLKVRSTPKGLALGEFAVERGSWNTVESLEAALRAFAKQHDLTRTTVYSVLPRHEMTSRILTLPSQDPVEIAAMVRNTAEEYVPYPQHELVIDAATVEKRTDGQSRVFAVFAHNDVVDGHVARLKAAGIEPARLFVSTACAASAAITADLSGGERVALVWLGLGGFDVMVFNGRTLEYARAIAGSHDWTQAANPDSDVLEELGVEVRASLAAHRRESEDGLGADSIALCCEWADASPIAEALSVATGLECETADLLTGVGARGESIPCQPAVAIGAALAAQDRAPLSINLVPKSLVQARAATEAKSKAIRFGALAAAVLVCAGGVYAQAVYQRQAYLEELQTQVDAIQPAGESVAIKRRQLARIQRQVDASGSALELIARLSDLAPSSDLNVTSISFIHGKELVVHGRTTNLAEPDRLAVEMREMGRTDVPQFSRARGGPWKETTENAQPVFEYELLVPFPEEDAAPVEESYEDDVYEVPDDV